MEVPRILIVDDDHECRRTLLRLLGTRFHVTDVGTAEDALDLVLYGQQFDVILCDMGMTGWSGSDLYKRLKRRGDAHASRFVVLSGEDVKGQRAALAEELGERLLRKPVDPAALLEVLAGVVARAAA